MQLHLTMQDVSMAEFEFWVPPTRTSSSNAAGRIAKNYGATIAHATQTRLAVTLFCYPFSGVIYP